MEKEETEKSVFMNPFTDVGFKIFFEQNKPSTIEFLNDLLAGQEEIVSLEFLDKEMNRETRDGRTVIYDLYCKTSDNRRIIIEMQRAQQQNFKERALYYMCRSIVLQGEPGKTWDYQLDAVYGVFFMDFNLEEKAKQQLMREVLLSDKENGGVFYEKFRMYFIEIPLFEKSEQDCSSKIDCWIYILKNMENLDTIPFKGWLKTLDQLEETMRVASLDKNGRELYEASLKQYRDLNAVIAYQKDKNAREREEARAKGLAEGRAEGIAKGRAEGRAEERAKAELEKQELTAKAYQEKLESARKLKQLGVAPEIISQAHCLTIEDINKL